MEPRETVHVPLYFWILAIWLIFDTTRAYPTVHRTITSSPVKFTKPSSERPPCNPQFVTASHQVHGHFSKIKRQQSLNFSLWASSALSSIPWEKTKLGFLSRLRSKLRIGLESINRHYVTAVPSLLPHLRGKKKSVPLTRSSPLFSASSYRQSAGEQCYYFGRGTVDGYVPINKSWVLGTGISTYTAAKKKFPDLPLQYLSHMYGGGNLAWSVSLPVSTSGPFSVVLGFAEIQEMACNSSPTAGYRIFRVTVGNSSKLVDLMASVGCGRSFRLSVDSVFVPGKLLTVLLEGVTRNAILSTACISTGTLPITPPLAESSSPEATSNIDASVPPTSHKWDDIVYPNSSYDCINFGSEKLKTYIQYDKSLITGYTKSIDSSSARHSRELPEAYQSSVEGEHWTYRVNLPRRSRYRIVVGFVETSPKFCKTRIKGGEPSARIFMVSIEGVASLIDLQHSAGCYSPYQAFFETQDPKQTSVDVSFSAVSGRTTVSVVCLAEITNHHGSAPSIPKITSSTSTEPISSSRSTTSKVPTTSFSPSGFHCFKFGTFDVSGFSDAIHSSTGEELWYYSDPTVTIHPLSSSSRVYQSHLFGPEFNIVIDSSSTGTLSIVFGFAEIFARNCASRARIFRLSVNGLSRTVDVFDEVGCNTPFNVRFDGVVPVAGTVTVTFTSNFNNAMISGLCLQEQTRDARPTQGLVDGFPSPVLQNLNSAKPPFVVKVISVISPSVTPSPSLILSATPSTEKGNGDAFASSSPNLMSTSPVIVSSTPSYSAEVSSTHPSSAPNTAPTPELAFSAEAMIESSLSSPVPDPSGFLIVTQSPFSEPPDASKVSQGTHASSSLSLSPSSMVLKGPASSPEASETSRASISESMLPSSIFTASFKPSRSLGVPSASMTASRSELPEATSDHHSHDSSPSISHSAIVTPLPDMGAYPSNGHGTAMSSSEFISIPPTWSTTLTFSHSQTFPTVSSEYSLHLATPSMTGKSSGQSDVDPSTSTFGAMSEETNEPLSSPVDPYFSSNGITSPSSTAMGSSEPSPFTGASPSLLPIPTSTLSPTPSLHSSTNPSKTLWQPNLEKSPSVFINPDLAAASPSPSISLEQSVLPNLSIIVIPSSAPTISSSRSSAPKLSTSSTNPGQHPPLLSHPFVDPTFTPGISTTIPFSLSTSPSAPTLYPVESPRPELTSDFRGGYEDAGDSEASIEPKTPELPFGGKSTSDPSEYPGQSTSGPSEIPHSPSGPDAEQSEGSTNSSANSGGWHDLMSRTSSRAFPVLMGVLGTLLVLLLILLICLSVFQCGPFSDTYSSQYSQPGPQRVPIGIPIDKPKGALGLNNTRNSDGGSYDASANREDSELNDGILKVEAPILLHGIEHDTVGYLPREETSAHVVSNESIQNNSRRMSSRRPRIFGAMTGFESVLGRHPECTTASLQSCGCLDSQTISMLMKGHQPNPRNSSCLTCLSPKPVDTATQGGSCNINVNNSVSPLENRRSRLNDEELIREQVERLTSNYSHNGALLTRLQPFGDVETPESLIDNCNDCRNEGISTQNPFQVFPRNIAESRPEHFNVGLSNQQNAVARVVTSSLMGKAFVFPDEGTMYKSNGSNLALSPCECGVCINSSSQNIVPMDQTRHIKAGERFISLGLEENGNSQSRGSLDGPWSSWWMRRNHGENINRGEYCNEIVSRRNSLRGTARVRDREEAKQLKENLMYTDDIAGNTAACVSCAASFPEQSKIGHHKRSETGNQSSEQNASCTSARHVTDDVACIQCSDQSILDGSGPNSECKLQREQKDLRITDASNRLNKAPETCMEDYYSDWVQ